MRGRGPIRRRYLLAALILFCFVPSAFAQTPIASRPRVLLPRLVIPVRRDTILHATAGAMSAMVAAGIGTALYGPAAIATAPLLLPALAASTALTAGIGKETLDSTGFGDPQWSDIIHTIIGGALASGLIAIIELNGGSSAASRQGQETAYFAAGAALSLPIAVGMVQEIRAYLARRRKQR